VYTVLSLITLTLQSFSFSSLFCERCWLVIVSFIFLYLTSNNCFYFSDSWESVNCNRALRFKNRCAYLHEVVLQWQTVLFACNFYANVIERGYFVLYFVVHLVLVLRCFPNFFVSTPILISWRLINKKHWLIANEWDSMCKFSYSLSYIMLKWLSESE